MCSREHPVLVYQDTRALELEVMEEGDLPGMIVTRAQGAGGLEVYARVVSREQQSLCCWIGERDRGIRFRPARPSPVTVPG